MRQFPIRNQPRRCVRGDPELTKAEISKLLEGKQKGRWEKVNWRDAHTDMDGDIKSGGIA